MKTRKKIGKGRVREYSPEDKHEREEIIEGKMEMVKYIT